jgi:hypothetical protein
VKLWDQILTAEKNTAGLSKQQRLSYQKGYMRWGTSINRCILALFHLEVKRS